MKVLLLAGLVVASVLPWSITVQANTSSAETVHLLRGRAIPNNALVSNPTYQLELVAEESNLEGLMISLPQGLKVRSGIVVEDISPGKLSPQKLVFRSEIVGNQLEINFGQAVPVGTVLRVSLLGVRPPLSQGNTWLFPIAVKTTGSSIAQSLGLLRVTTFTPV